jgi:serine/threonine protein kinase
MTEETLFHESLARPPAERAAFLDAACAGRPELQAAVEALLAAHEASGNLLDRPLADLAKTIDSGTNLASPDAPVPSGVTVDQPSRIAPNAVLAGRYKLVEEIGEGGMGTVFMAQQTAPVKRLVAVKIIKPGMDSTEVLARFEAERQALAVMEHPNIARVLDAGTAESGRPFFVMELVKGTPITQYCDQHRLTPRQRLELFLPVCQAIQHAHQKGVIHRDIKPSNVLVALYDDRPVPKVIDFGLAKAMGQSLTEKTLITGFGALVGTPEYMSPEQADLNNLDIDTRCDIYTLGVLLYELLTGSTPVDRRSLANAAVLEVLRIVREVDAPRPSAKLSGSANLPSIAANRGTDPARLTKLLRGELDWVLLKALEKDRGRRYETANGLARDIERYLADEVVEARSPSTTYRLRKLVRRHKAEVIAASLVLVALLAGIAGTTFGLFHARAAQGRAEAGEKLAGDRLEQVVEEKKHVEVEKAKVEAEKKRTEAEKKNAEQEKQIAQAVQYFLQTKLLGQADVYQQANSLLRAGRTAADTNQRLTVRELLDRAAIELASERIDAIFRNQPRVQAAVLRTVGQTYQGVGERQRAIAFLDRSLALSRKELGPDHPDTLTSMIDLAWAYFTDGEPDLAVPLFEETLKLRKAKLGLDHRDTLESMNMLALAYQDAGKLDLALPLFEETLKLRRATLGPRHLDSVVSMGNLARAYRLTGKPQLALTLMEETFKLMKAELGPDHPDTLTSMGELASAYEDDGKLDLALPLFDETLKLKKAKLGPEHPDTLITMNNLAKAYWHAKQFDKSIPIYECLLKLSAAKLGRQHPYTLRRMANLGVTYKDAGRLTEALPLLEEAHRSLKKTPSLQWVGEALLDCYIRAGNREKVISLGKELVASARRQLPKDSLPLAQELASKGLSLLFVQDFAEAEPLLREALATRKKSQPDSWSTFCAESMLGGALLGQKKYNEAEPLLLSGYRGMNEREATIPLYGGGELRLTEALERLVQLYDEMGKKDDAAKWRKELDTRKGAAKGGRAQIPAVEKPSTSTRQSQGK